MVPMLGADAYVYMLAGLAALGAVVVALAPFVGLEPAPKQSVIPAAGQPEAAEQPFWRRKRDFLRQTRSALSRLRSTADGQLPVEPLPKRQKRRSKSSQQDGDSRLAADTGPVPAAPREADPPGAAVTVPEPADSAGPVLQDDRPPDADAESGQAESQSPASGALDAFSQGPADAGDSGTFDEDEDDENDEESGGFLGSDSDAKSDDTDSLFDLFSTEIVEDNEAGKLAASLDDVDVRDLLSEAQQILGEIRSVRQARRHGTPPG